MNNFDAISRLPEAVATVLSDDSGSLLQWVGEIDGETAGAVHAFARQSLGQAGEMLGLGAFERVSIVSAKQACIVATQGNQVLGVYSAAGKAFLALEKKLEAALGG